MTLFNHLIHIIMNKKINSIFSVAVIMMIASMLIIMAGIVSSTPIIIKVGLISMTISVLVFYYGCVVE